MLGLDLICLNGVFKDDFLNADPDLIHVLKNPFFFLVHDMAHIVTLGANRIRLCIVFCCDGLNILPTNCLSLLYKVM